MIGGRGSGWGWVGLLLLAAASGPAEAVAQDQEVVGSGERLSVFFDCEGRECFTTQTFFRTEITWVDWVRNREDSDVHVIITDQQTGSGGTEFQLDLLGGGELEGAEDQLFFSSLGTDVEQERLDGLTTTLAIGLARFATLLGYRDFVRVEALELEGPDPNQRVFGAQEVEDPWNLWVFEVGASGNFDDTELRDTQRASANFMASRTTPTWKLIFGAGGSRNVIETRLNDGSLVESTLTDWRAGTQIVRALATHWSGAVSGTFSKTPRDNQKLRFDSRLGVEYSVFPYEEATRRSLTVRYTIGPSVLDYEETTVFGKEEETRVQQGFRAGYSHRQPWGDGFAGVYVAHFLDDIDQHNVTLWGGASFRIARGLSLNGGWTASWVTDQIYLSAGGETDEEILLNLRTRASDFNFNVNLGFSYRFGSIFNNVVNNRFQGEFGR